MSNEITEPSAGYFGIINGIIYRIDANTGLSKRMFRQAPLGIPLAPARGHPVTGTTHPPPADPAAPLPSAAPSMAARTGRLTGVKPIAGERLSGKEEPMTKPFNRDSAEPLRAGHPDLWNLLVAGTCLEGSTFHSAG